MFSLLVLPSSKFTTRQRRYIYIHSLLECLKLQLNVTWIGEMHPELAMKSLSYTDIISVVVNYN
jgi:hypothetical protein